MRSIVPLLAISLICFTAPVTANSDYVKWARGAPPDIDNLRAFERGEISPLQEELADAYLEVAKQWHEKWDGEGQDRNSADACRKALMLFPDHEGANELYDALPPLPEEHRNYDSPELSEAYLKAIKEMQSEHIDAFIELAAVFADKWLPLSAEYCLHWARQGAELDRRAQRDLDERIEPIQQRIAEHALRISSYNVLFPGGVDINQKAPEYWRWEKRRPLQEAVIRHMQADIIGLQETSRWRPVLIESWYEVYEFAGVSGSDMIYYNKHRFELVKEAKSPSFWRGRRMPWARFRCRYSGMIINHFNVHLPHRSTVAKKREKEGEDPADYDTLQIPQCEACLKEIERVSSPLTPSIFTGDFNTRGGSPWRILVEEGPFSLEHSYRDRVFGIDWILTTPHLLNRFAGTLYALRDGVRASDHHQILMYLERPDRKEAKAAYEAAPDSDELLLAYIKVLMLYDTDEAKQVMADALDGREKGKRDALMWTHAEMLDDAPAEAVEVYRDIAKETNDEAMEPRATFRAFELLVRADLMDRREMRLLQRFAKRRSTPPEYQEKAQALLEKLETENS